MNGYEIIDHRPLTVRIHAPTLEQLFEIAGYAVFDQGFALDEIPATYSRPVIAAGDTWSELLYAWIEELLAMSRIEGIVPSYFTVDRLEEGGVQGSAAGLPQHETAQRSPRVIGLIDPRPDPVPIPDGWWVDLGLEVEPRLRPL
jgi:SHS2 domain-containing protein